MVFVGTLSTWVVLVSTWVVLVTTEVVLVATWVVLAATVLRHLLLLFLGLRPVHLTRQVVHLSF